MGSANEHSTLSDTVGLLNIEPLGAICGEITQDSSAISSHVPHQILTRVVQ
jgi:hypothetical protein